MNGFIEVTYSHQLVMVNVTHIVMVEQRFIHKDHDDTVADGCRIKLRIGGPNESDGEILVSESYDDIKNKIVTAVGKS